LTVRPKTSVGGEPIVVLAHPCVPSGNRCRGGDEHDDRDASDRAVGKHSLLDAECEEAAHCERVDAAERRHIERDKAPVEMPQRHPQAQHGDDEGDAKSDRIFAAEEKITRGQIR